MNKILVPTDFSPYADSALKIAVNIAQKSQAEIILLHIMLTPDHAIVHASEQGINISGTATDYTYLEDVVESTRSNMRELITKSNYDNISYQIASGNISQTVIKEAEATQTNLIVMGTQGEGGYDAIFVGSNAEKVVRFASCPVLTVRNAKEEVNFKNIVFACDFNAKYTYPMEEVKTFQKIFNSQVHLVHINTPASFNTTASIEAKASLFIDKYNLENYTTNIYCDFVQDDGIHHFADSIEADLITVASRKRKGFSRLLGGSVSEGVVNASQIPVLTLSLNKE